MGWVMCFLLTTAALVRTLNLLFIYISCIIPALWNWNKLFRKDIFIPRVVVAMPVCWMIWCWYSYLPAFKCIFQLYSSGLSVSWYGYKHAMTLCFGQLHPITVCGTVFWVCVVLVLSAIMFSFTSSLTKFYVIMIVVTIIGILWPLFLFWTTHLYFLEQSILVMKIGTSIEVRTPGHSR